MHLLFIWIMHAMADRVSLKQVEFNTISSSFGRFMSVQPLYVEGLWNRIKSSAHDCEAVGGPCFVRSSTSSRSLPTNP